MSRKLLVIVVVVLLVVAGVAGIGRWLAVRDVTGGARQDAAVGKALAAHEAELRAVPGVTMLGTYAAPGEPPYIVVTVEEITPQVRAAVPATLDGYRVVLEKDTPPTSPPLLAGEVTRVKAATAEEAGLGLAGSLIVAGDLYPRGQGYGNAEPCTLKVRVPAGADVWHPMGEGKDFIEFAEVRAGDTVRVTLEGRPARGARVATAADVEAY